jgi:hypothetical protein
MLHMIPERRILVTDSQGRSQNGNALSVMPLSIMRYSASHSAEDVAGLRMRFWVECDRICLCQLTIAKFGYRLLRKHPPGWALPNKDKEYVIHGETPDFLGE